MVQTSFDGFPSYRAYDSWLGKRTQKKLAHNTWCYREEFWSTTCIAVEFHSTKIIRMFKDTDLFVLYSGGWNTPTTQQRMTQFSPAWVSSEDYILHATYQGGVYAINGETVIGGCDPDPDDPNLTEEEHKVLKAHQSGVFDDMLSEVHASVYSDDSSYIWKIHSESIEQSRWNLSPTLREYYKRKARAIYG